MDLAKLRQARQPEAGMHGLEAGNNGVAGDGAAGDKRRRVEHGAELTQRVGINMLAKNNAGTTTQHHAAKSVANGCLGAVGNHDATQRAGADEAGRQTCRQHHEHV